MEAQRQAKIKETMEAHLKSKGYPNMTSQQILAELPILWQKLATAGLLDGLIGRGFTYELFAQSALREAQKAEIMAKMGIKINNTRR